MERRALLLAGAALAACATPPEPPACPITAGLRLVERAWHTEIGLPVAMLRGELAVFATRFPGAHTLLFGFGKRDFMMAEAGGAMPWLTGPIPGPAIIQVTALRVAPEAAMATRILALPLDEPGAAALSAALWASFATTPEGLPPPVHVTRGGSGFHTAARGYSLAYTCNTWTEEMLAAAGLPMEVRGAVLASGVMRAAAALPGACRPGMPLRTG